MLTLLKTGQIQLRPFCGNSITADLARVTVSSCSDVNAGCNKKIDIWCAIVAGLHDELISTSEAVDRLYVCMRCECFTCRRH